MSQLTLIVQCSVHYSVPYTELLLAYNSYLGFVGGVPIENEVSYLMKLKQKKCSYLTNIFDKSILRGLCPEKLFIISSRFSSIPSMVHIRSW